MGSLPFALSPDGGRHRVRGNLISFPLPLINGEPRFLQASPPGNRKPKTENRHFSLDKRPDFYEKIRISGNNSAVECNLAKVEVAGSNPVSRSRGGIAKR